MPWIRGFGHFTSAPCIRPSNEFLLSEALACGTEDPTRRPITCSRASRVRDPTESLPAAKTILDALSEAGCEKSTRAIVMGEFLVVRNRARFEPIFVNLKRFEHDLEIGWKVNTALMPANPEQQIRQPFHPRRSRT